MDFGEVGYKRYFYTFCALKVILEICKCKTKLQNMIKINVDIYYSADGKIVDVPLNIQVDSSYIPSDPIIEFDKKIIDDFISPPLTHEEK